LACASAWSVWEGQTIRLLPDAVNAAMDEFLAAN